MRKPYVIMTEEKILGIYYFSNEREMRRYIDLYPMLVFCMEIAEKESARKARRHIRKELREDVEKIINELWGHIPEISNDDEEKKENGPANS